MSFSKGLLLVSTALIMNTSFAQELKLVPNEEIKEHFLKEVKLAKLTPEDESEFISQLEKSNIQEKLTTSQYFVASDRNPKKQNAALVYWDKDNNKIDVYGYTKVSTGSVRIKHFYTPLGWFENVTSNGSYRAQGTKNENGIRGYGAKGMRVWDFGWVPSSSGVVKNLNIDIRFQMHATDPDFLESRLGRPDSQGCLRVHNTFNKFLDHYGIIDKNYENEKSWVLNKNRTPAQMAGSWLYIFDSSK